VFFYARIFQVRALCGVFPCVHARQRAFCVRAHECPPRAVYR
jgi:hypothetical protein